MSAPASAAILRYPRLSAFAEDHYTVSGRLGVFADEAFGMAVRSGFIFV